MYAIPRSMFCDKFHRFLYANDPFYSHHSPMLPILVLQVPFFSLKATFQAF